MQVPNATKVKLADGSIDLSTDTIKVLLLNSTSSYTFNPDNHEFVDDLDGTSDGDAPGNEFGDTNYSRKTIANQTLTQDDADDEAVLDGDDLEWTDLGGSEEIQTVVLYIQRGGDDTTPGDDPVLAVLDSANSGDLPLPTNGSNVTVTWNLEGITKLT